MGRWRALIQVKGDGGLTIRGGGRPTALPRSGTIVTQVAVRPAVQVSAARRQAGRVAVLTLGFRNAPSSLPASRNVTTSAAQISVGILDFQSSTGAVSTHLLAAPPSLAPCRRRWRFSCCG